MYMYRCLHMLGNFLPQNPNFFQKGFYLEDKNHQYFARIYVYITRSYTVSKSCTVDNYIYISSIYKRTHICTHQLHNIIIIISLFYYLPLQSTLEYIWDKTEFPHCCQCHLLGPGSGDTVTDDMRRVVVLVLPRPHIVNQSTLDSTVGGD